MAEFKVQSRGISLSIFVVLNRWSARSEEILSSLITQIRFFSLRANAYNIIYHYILFVLFMTGAWVWWKKKKREAIKLALKFNIQFVYDRRYDSWGGSERKYARSVIHYNIISSGLHRRSPPPTRQWHRRWRVSYILVDKRHFTSSALHDGQKRFREIVVSPVFTRSPLVVSRAEYIYI